MGKVTSHARVIMFKGNHEGTKEEWVVSTIRRAETLKNQSYVAIAVADNEAAAHQMMLGLRINKIVNSLDNIMKLPDELKTALKTEIAMTATQYKQS